MLMEASGSGSGSEAPTIVSFSSLLHRAVLARKALDGSLWDLKPGYIPVPRFNVGALMNRIGFWRYIIL